jgi:hypothetical protein
MVKDTPWNVDDPNGLVWKNSDSHQQMSLVSREDYADKIGELEPVLENNPDADWIFMGDNSVITTLQGNEKIAKELAREWMRDHPNPSGIIS